MSLNGLEDPKVQEAHEAAVAEPGGWFLLKYSSRDEVELLGRGNGGIVEVRNNVAEYEETSPLYGFLRYRRRSVLIKYLPEGCSRLIQARVTVHFNAICERFFPYDTTFEIAAARELKDSKLSAACSLHAASGSNSSSTSSLRRRRLMEIAEEEEEEQRVTKRQSVLPEDEERPETRDEPASPTAPVTLNSELAASPEHSNFTATTTADIPNFLGIDERPMSPTESVDAARRNSSQSNRADLYTYTSYPYGKPKVKLAPRPSADVNTRPGTAGNFRPVSQIPAGFKLFGKGSKKAGKGKEEDTAVLPETIETPTPPTATEETQPEVGRPVTSSGVSTVSTIMPPPPPPPTAAPVKPAMTPEKARLMKAMKLRREKKKKMAFKPSETPTSTEVPAPSEEEEKVEDRTDAEDNATEGDTNGDSGIALDASSSSMNTDQASEGSHPASPMIASSELDHSTKASSLSESTDETVQAKGEDGLEEDEDSSSYYEESIEEAHIIDNLATISEKNPEVSVEEMPVYSVDELDSDLNEESTAEKPETTSSQETPAIAPAAENHWSIPAHPLSTILEPETPKIPDTPEPKPNDDAVATNKDEEEPQSPTSSPRLRVPKSKFSTQDLRSAAKDSALPTINSPPAERSLRQGSPVIVTEEANPGEGSFDKQGSEAEPQLHPPKRKAFVEPIKTDFEPHSRPVSRSDLHLSDDESLMEELQSATFQEAKPMLVAKSPITPVFPSPTKGGGSGISSHVVRTVSNPVRGTLLPPTDVTQSSARSLSGGAAYLHQVTQQRPPSRNLSTKTNMGSSISQRIKALEKLSAGSGEPVSVSLIGRDRPSSTFFSVRKGREPSRSPSVADRANSFTRRTPPSRSGSRDQSPDKARHPRRERSGSVASRLSMFEPAGGPGGPPPPAAEGHSPRALSRGRPESISVTAKIVRDPNQCITRTMEPPKDPSEYNPVQLKQSPLLVDHQKATTPPVPQWTPLANETKETIQERRMSKETRRSESRDAKDEKSRRSSLSVVRDFIKDRRKSLTSPSSDALVAPNSSAASPSPTRPPSTHQNSSFTQRLSISSRRSSFSKDKDSVTSPTTEGSASGDDKSEKKKSSRAGRFMRRLSSLSGGRGKVSSPPTGISPTVKEEEAPASPKNPPPASAPPAAASPSIVSYMGDVNVQFPDTLLWKRRNMCLDSHGFLILSAVPGGPTSRPAQSTKRYHLSEFRTPCIPDVEVQELPNSVVLDLIEGSGVQVACEDRHGQMNVLKILQEAHAGHATFGQ